MLEPADVPRRMEQLSAAYPAATRDMLENVVRAVLTTMRGDIGAGETTLLAEVQELAQTLANARAEIAALQADDITASHIPSATDELDAIFAHTASATTIILENCEKLDALAPTLTGEAFLVVHEVTTRIYEACGFQDITGQRITKIVATLKSIERKVAHTIDVFGRDRAALAKPDQQAAPERKPAAPASLLNGPQTPVHAMDQTGVDALLASLE